MYFSTGWDGEVQVRIYRYLLYDPCIPVINAQVTQRHACRILTCSWWKNRNVGFRTRAHKRHDKIDLNYVMCICKLINSIKNPVTRYIFQIKRQDRAIFSCKWKIFNSIGPSIYFINRSDRYWLSINLAR